MTTLPSRTYNIIELLDELNVPYVTRGKNVGRNSVNIKCPCCSDPSYHLGIHKEYGIFHCWRCGVSGNLKKLLKLLRKRIDLSRFTTSSSSTSNTLNQTVPLTEGTFLGTPLIDFISEYEKVGKYILSYLKSRHCPYHYINLARVYAVNGQNGSIVGVSFPLYMFGKCLSSIVRYVIHPKGLRYYKAPDWPSFALFNYDFALQRLNGTLCLVEGPFDVFVCDRFIPTVALCASNLSMDQVRVLKDLNLRRLVIIIDGGTCKYEKKVEEIYMLLPFIKEKIVINLPAGEDPNSLGPDKMEEILKKEGVIQ